MESNKEEKDVENEAGNLIKKRERLRMERGREIEDGERKEKEKRVEKEITDFSLPFQ